MKRWLTVEQVADELACHPETVRRAIRRGDLAALRYGSLWRVTTDALDAFTDQHSTKRPA